MKKLWYAGKIKDDTINFYYTAECVDLSITNDTKSSGTTQNRLHRRWNEL